MVRRKSEHALLYGDGPQAPYHPLAAVEEELRAILARAGFQTVVHLGGSDVAPEELAECSLFVSYCDAFSQPPRSQTVGALLPWLDAGGGLLVIHNGISLQNDASFAALMGARFVMHPEARVLTLTAEARHPLAPDIEGFSLHEEPYRFETVAGGPPTEPLLWYEMEGTRYPAGWTGARGGGRFAYLMPGHDARSFRVPLYRKAIERCAKWVCERAP